MLDIFNTPTPQSANYQEFYFAGTGGQDGSGNQTWIKPRGASMVRFMLIGAGGGGGNGSTSAGGGGGGSGVVTSWIGPAIFVPDSLVVIVGQGATSGSGTQDTIICFRQGGTYYTLLTAKSGTSGTTLTAGAAGGVAMTNNYFGAAGIFTSIAGQAGSNGSSTGGGQGSNASTTTFLSGGSGGSGGAGVGGEVTPNYGYPVAAGAATNTAVKGQDGFFITQPILVGRGGAGGGTTTTAGGAGGKGGIGCGGGGSGEDALTGGRGGDGAVFVWAW